MQNYLITLDLSPLHLFLPVFGLFRTNPQLAVKNDLYAPSTLVKPFHLPTYSALVNELIEAKQQGWLAKFLKTIEKEGLLICDEWGFLLLRHEGAQLLFQVVSACYERKSLILTTYLEFSKWSTIFYDEKLTAALSDRLVHYGHLITFQSPSYRYQHSSLNF